MRLDDGSTVLVRESASAALAPVHADDTVWLTFGREDASVLAADETQAAPRTPTTATS